MNLGLRKVFKGDRKYALLLVVIIFIGAGLRFFNLGTKSLWYDEMLTWNEAKASFPILLHYMNMWEGAPFLTPFLIGRVIIFNDSEFFIRLLPCIVGICSIIVLYFFSREFLSKAASLLCSLFLAFSSVQIERSQDARYYPLVVFLSIFVLWAFIRYFRFPSIKNLAWFLVASLLFLFTYYSYLLFFVALNLVFFSCVFQGKFSRKESSRWILSQVVLMIGIVFLWFLQMRFQVAKYAAGSPGFMAAGFPQQNSLLAYWKFVTTTTWKLFDYFYANNFYVTLILVAFFVIGFFYLARDRRRSIVVVLFVCVLTINIILALLGKFLYIAHRHCLHLSPFYYLFVAAGFERMFFQQQQRRLAARVLFIALVCFFSVVGLRNAVAYLVAPGPHESKEIYAYLNKNVLKDDRIYVYAAAAYGFPYYYRNDPRIVRSGHFWDGCDQDAIKIAYEINFLLQDANSGWIVSMMQDRIGLTLKALSRAWNVDYVVTNEKKDFALYHISRK